jgi:hypothetical protein
VERLHTRRAFGAIGVIAHDHVDGNAVGVGVVDGHTGVLQTDIAVD